MSATPITAALPPGAAAHLRRRFGKDGERFLAGLDARLEQLCERWGLQDPSALPGALTGAAFTCTRDGAAVVLKLGVDATLVDLEAATLGHWRSLDVAVAVHERVRGAYLMERLYPGEPWRGDDRAVLALFGRLRAAAPAPAQLRGRLPHAHEQLRARLVRLRGELLSRPGCPLDGRDFDRGLSLLDSLGMGGDRVCHADIHSRSLLDAGGRPLLIDPMPALGPVGYDAAKWLGSAGALHAGERLCSVCALFGAERYIEALSRVAALHDAAVNFKYALAPEQLAPALAWARG